MVSWLGVLLAALVNMIVGAIWYSEKGFARLDSTPLKPRPKAPLYASFNSLVMALFLSLSFEIIEVHSALGGAFTGAFFWLGFIATTQVSSVIWCSHSFIAYLMHTGFKFVTFVLMGAILGALR